ncbi:MAG: hypothetical protein AB7M12_07960 [Hyphomonadaceae bacterium]
MKPFFLISMAFFAVAAGPAFADAGAAAVRADAAPSAPVDEVIGAEDLANLSGGDGVSLEVLTAQTLSAVNSGNTINGETISSGQVNLGENAFNGFNGIGNFIVNTGHNNNLQSTLNVNIVLAP